MDWSNKNTKWRKSLEQHESYLSMLTNEIMSSKAKRAVVFDTQSKVSRMIPTTSPSKGDSS